MTKEEVLKQIRSGKLAIKNDSQEDINKCAKIIWPDYEYVTKNNWLYYFQHPTRIYRYDFEDVVFIPSIPATKLLKLLTNKQTKMKPKTVEQWLNTLPEPYKSKALKYAKKEKTLDCTSHSKYNAISTGFTWKKTKEKYDFWNDVYFALHQNKPLPPFPKLKPAKKVAKKPVKKVVKKTTKKVTKKPLKK